MKKIIETIISKIQRRDPCFEIYPYFGLAPHKHSIADNGCVVGTMLEPQEKWPDNFVETENGCGLWYCPNKKCKAKCGGKL